MKWEVRTMRPATSCFNGVLFRKNLTRFWPLWGGYLAVWMAMLPGSLFLQAQSTTDAFSNWSAVHDGVLSRCVVSPWSSAVMGIVCAMALFSYLMSSRAANFTHALPVKRSALFLTNYLSGLCFIVAPSVLAALLTLPVEAALGYVNVHALLVWLAVNCLTGVYFFSFAVFCAMFTGHMLALPLFYGILSALPAALYYLIETLFRGFLFGFGGSDGMRIVARWLTPLWNFSERMSVNYYGNYTMSGSGFDPGNYRAVLGGMSLVWIYAAAGIVLAVAAALLYRRRATESAGDVVTFKAIRPVFLYGFGFTFALSVGILLFTLLFSYQNDRPWALLVCVLLCGTVGWFLGEMLLNKTFRVFSRSSWTMCACLLAGLLLMGCALKFDFFGAETRVPQVSDVTSVTVSGLNSMPYDDGSYLNASYSDPDDIAAVIALHQTIVDGRENLRSFSYPSDGVDSAKMAVESVSITYTLSNGATLSRSYDSIPVYAADLSDPGSITGLADALLNRPASVKQAYSNHLEVTDNAVFNSVTLTVYNTVTGASEDKTVETSADCRLIWNAVQEDLNHGSIGRRYLFDTDDRLDNTSFSNLGFEYQVPTVDAADVMLTGVGVDAPSAVYSDAADNFNYGYAAIALTPDAENTRAVLTSLGILDETHILLTNRQAQALPDSALYDSSAKTQALPD